MAAIPIPPHAPVPPPHFTSGTSLPRHVVAVDDWRPDHPILPARGAIHVNDWRPDFESEPTVVQLDRRGRSRSPLQFVLDDVDAVSKMKKGKKVTKPIETTFEGCVLQMAKPLNDQKPSWSRVTIRNLPFDDKKFLALVKDHRRRSRKSPVADFDRLTSSQQDVVLRLIAQHKEEERDPNADWSLVDVEKESIAHLIRPLEVRKIRIILKRQDKSANKIDENVLSGTARNFQSCEIIDLRDPPVNAKTSKGKNVTKKAQVDEVVEVFVEPQRREPVQRREPIQHVRDYQQPYVAGMPEMNRNPMPVQRPEFIQRHDDYQHDQDYRQPQPQFEHQTFQGQHHNQRNFVPDNGQNHGQLPLHGIQIVQGHNHDQGLGIAQHGHSQHQPLPPFGNPFPQAQLPAPLPSHGNGFPVMPQLPPQCMPPPIGNPFLPNLEFIPSGQYVQQPPRERSQSPFDDRLPQSHRNARPSTPRLQRSVSAKRIRQLEGEVESLREKVDHWHVSSESSTGDDSIFSSLQSKESFTPPSTPPRRDRVLKSILHHRKSVDHRAQAGNQTSGRGHRDERVELKPAHTYQSRGARHSPERREYNHDRRSYSSERPRDSPRYSVGMPHYSPERPRYQEERPQYREQQLRYREERMPAPILRRASAYEHSHLEREPESRYMPRIQRRLTDYELNDIEEQYRRQREPLRRWSDDLVQDPYEPGRRMEAGYERRRSGARYYD